MRILYLGEGKVNSGSAQRARALGRLGHQVTHLCIDEISPSGRLGSALHYRTGYRFLQPRVKRWVDNQVARATYEVAWVDSGALIGPEVVKSLKSAAGIVVNYNCDDPTGRRDWARWHTFRQAIPFYDATVVVRNESQVEYAIYGAKNVIRVLRSYDEIDHARLVLTSRDQKRWSSDVLFVGTWMPERGPFLAELMSRGVPLTIYGDRWRKAPEWKTLARAYKGAAIEGRDYVAAVQCAKIALGLLSKGNRDLHTIRSGEIPYIGALFCAERTTEHQLMYLDGEEAVFWSDAAECAAQCRILLENDSKRRLIAERGHQKVLKLGIGHENVLASILSQLR